jgi:hypothetical protein
MPKALSPTSFFFSVTQPLLIARTKLIATMVVLLASVLLVLVLLVVLVLILVVLVLLVVLAAAASSSSSVVVSIAAVAIEMRILICSCLNKVSSDSGGGEAVRVLPW